MFSSPKVMVTILVGKGDEPAKFMVHKDFACHYSPVFKAAGGVESIIFHKNSHLFTNQLGNRGNGDKRGVALLQGHYRRGIRHWQIRPIGFDQTGPAFSSDRLVARMKVCPRGMRISSRQAQSHGF